MRDSSGPALPRSVAAGGGLMLTFGELCAGIGGFGLGLERAGMQCRWQVEKDAFCQQVLAKHWPHVARYGDIRDVGKHNLQPVDLICAGIPCQPFSDAGERRGEADDRNLWPEMLRIVQECQPRWIIIENVTGFIGLYLDRVLADLEVEGYEAWAVVLPAVAFGAPHVRARVFVVAYSDRASLQFGRAARHLVSEAGRSQDEAQERERTGNAAHDSSATMADANGEREQQSLRALFQEWRRARDSGQDLVDIYTASYPKSDGREQGGIIRAGREPVPADGRGVGSGRANAGWEEGQGRWAVEPPVGRVAHGVPRRVDRLRALGNAVVPAVVEHIGRCILEVERKLA